MDVPEELYAVVGIDSDADEMLVLDVFVPSPAPASEDRIAEFVEAAAVTEDSEAVEKDDDDVELIPVDDAI